MRALKPFKIAVNPILHHSNRLFATFFHKFETLVREREIASIPENDPVMGLVDEMKQFVNEFNNHENMDSFFTRKSHQNVLSVVQCFIDSKYEYFRGRNIEVSLPSGTICAERSALANATANNLSLHRKHFKRIAVIDPHFNIIGLEPCGVCKEYLQKFQEESPEFCVVTFPDSEFKSIYEYFPANYPVENVDAEQTQKALEQIWICLSCDVSNSGYSTDCYLCGYPKNAMSRKFKYSIFQNPSLALKVVNAIHENYYPDEAFTYIDISGKLNDLDTKQCYNVIVHGILAHLASSRRKVLYRLECNKKFKIYKESFGNYRESLTKNLHQ